MVLIATPQHQMVNPVVLVEVLLLIQVLELVGQEILHQHHRHKEILEVVLLLLEHLIMVLAAAVEHQVLEQMGHQLSLDLEEVEHHLQLQV